MAATRAMTIENFMVDDEIQAVAFWSCSGEFVRATFVFAIAGRN